MTLYTIGYQGISAEAFLALLKENGVETVVDVRETPYSRKPGFSKKPLAQMLAAAGLHYVHRIELGCPKPIRDRHRQDGDWQRYTQAFLAHLATQQRAVDELAQLAATSTCALLCYEADHNACHRSLVAEAVGRRGGMWVEHLGALATDIPTQGVLEFLWL